MSVWLIGHCQGGWKLGSRPWFDSWHFAAATQLRQKSVVEHEIANF